jgi:hypothetical protein
VQTHLVHVFAKLDIVPRAQLAAEVTRHQTVRRACADTLPPVRLMLCGAALRVVFLVIYFAKGMNW